MGYPQLFVSTGDLKGTPIQQPICIATEWNHLEAGLAYAAGLPILVLHHNTVSRGIFDRGVLNAFIHSLDLTLPNWSMQPAINGAIKKWIQQCESGNSSYSGKSTQQAIGTNKPFCPNCSSGTKSIYLSPIPAPFNDLAGGNWECSQCKYVQ